MVSLLIEHITVLEVHDDLFDPFVGFDMYLYSRSSLGASEYTLM